MSNSKLISYTKISPYKTVNRNHKIDTVTIHCTDGQSSVEGLGITFQNNGASCNYAIGNDGRIALIVDEGDSSWCSSNRNNDNRAITIECASDNFHPYKVKDVVYQSLINLLVDICQRNGIKRLLWKGDKSLIGQVDKQNMTVHRWFANKTCPGDYLYNLHGQIADEVNARLNPTSNSVNNGFYRVQVGAFKIKSNADALERELDKKGFSGFVTKGHDNLYKVQVGAFKIRTNAENYKEKLIKAGYDGFIVHQ